MNDNYVEKLVKKKSRCKDDADSYRCDCPRVTDCISVSGVFGIFKCGILWAYQCFSACMAYLTMYFI